MNDTDYTLETARLHAWATLAKTPAFTDFFLPHVIGGMEPWRGVIGKVAAELVESCPPDGVAGRRYALSEFQGLRIDAVNHMRNAITKTRPNQ
jgi:hypothetical protein